MFIVYCCTYYVPFTKPIAYYNCYKELLIGFQGY